MSIQKLSLAGVQKTRAYIQETLIIPDLENNPTTVSLLEMEEEPPEPTSLDSLGDLFRAASDPEDVISAPNREGRWFLSSANAAIALKKLPGLNLRKDVRLVTYLLRTAKGGQGVTWAVPEWASGTAQLEEALVDRDVSQAPQPQPHLDHLMEALEGDRSGTSYVMASLYWREVQEFGWVGSQCRWVHHRLVDQVPAQAQWEWKTKQPQDFLPKVRVFEDGRVAVEFFTCYVKTPVTLYRHLDQYTPDSYVPQSTDRPMAIALKSS